MPQRNKRSRPFESASPERSRPKKFVSVALDLGDWQKLFWESGRRGIGVATLIQRQLVPWLKKLPPPPPALLGPEELTGESNN